MRRNAAIVLAAATTAAVVVAVLATTGAAALAPPPADVLPPPTPSAITSPATKTIELCVVGAGDAVAAAHGSAPLDPAALARAARLAFAADRTAERLHAAPAWPQRIGVDAAPPTRRCVAVALPR